MLTRSAYVEYSLVYQLRLAIILIGLSQWFHFIYVKENNYLKWIKMVSLRNDITFGVAVAVYYNKLPYIRFVNIIIKIFRLTISVLYI